MNKNRFFTIILFLYCLLIILVTFNLIIFNLSFNYTFVSFCGYDEFLNFNKMVNIVIIITILFFTILFVLHNKKNKINISRISKMMILIILVFLSIIDLSCSIRLFKLNYCSIDSKISGNSMYPTFSDGESITIKYSNKINRFDVAIFKINQESNINCSFDDKYYIKRIIGLPNDKVVWQDNKLYINNEPINEYYLNGYYDGINYESSPFNGIFTYIEDGIIKSADSIPEGYCFVLGDNRQKKINGEDWSLDSRVFGLVPITNIVGIVQ